MLGDIDPPTFIISEDDIITFKTSHILAKKINPS